LESRHARGLRTVLIVDEAHGLSQEVLEEIRLLANFETNTTKLLQIVLTGQPELRTVLNGTALRQLKQRVALRCKIEALPNTEETGNYIRHRLEMAGAERTDIFTPESLDFIYRCTEGIPRNINNLCDNSLLAGFSAEAQTIYRDIVEEVANAFDMLPHTDAGTPLDGNLASRETPTTLLTHAGREELLAATAGNSEIDARNSTVSDDLSIALAAQGRQREGDDATQESGRLESAF
jgi:hypothetical protein